MALTKEQIKKIPGMKAKGMSTREVAEVLGVHKETVLRWERKLRKAGYEVISKKGRPAIIL